MYTQLNSEQMQSCCCFAVLYFTSDEMLSPNAIFLIQCMDFERQLISFVKSL